MNLDEFNAFEDSTSDGEKIKKYTGDVEWTYLEPHYKAGNIVSISSELNLVDVAQAFSQDNKAQVQAWLKSEAIIQPTATHAAKWEEKQSIFNATIVRPFILIQEVQH